MHLRRWLGRTDGLFGCGLSSYERDGRFGIGLSIGRASPRERDRLFCQSHRGKGQSQLCALFPYLIQGLLGFGESIRLDDVSYGRMASKFDASLQSRFDFAEDDVRISFAAF